MWKTTKLSLREAVPSAFPPAMNEHFCCSTSSSTFGVVRALLSAILIDVWLDFNTVVVWQDWV